MALVHISPRGADYHNETASQPQSPVQGQTSTHTQTSVAAQDNETHAVDMPSARSTITLAEYLIPGLELNTDKTSKSPFSEVTAPETQPHTKEYYTVEDEQISEEPDSSVDGQSEAGSERSRSSSSSKQGTSTLYRTGARSLHWYQALRGGQYALGSRSKVVLRENVINPVHRKRTPGILCLSIAMVRRRARMISRPPSAYSVLLVSRSPDLNNVTDFQPDSEQEEPISPIRLKSMAIMKTAVNQYFDDIECHRNITPEDLTDNFDRLVQDLQRFRKERDVTARKFQKCYSSHSGTKTSPADCDDCFMYMTQIENGYYGACAQVRAMMTELRKGICASVMRANMHREIETQGEESVIGGMFEDDVNLQRLEETKSMLQSLEDDAEAAKGWPQASSSDVLPEDGQAPKKPQNDEDARTNGIKSSPVKSKKGKSKEQKKKKKKGKR